MKKLILTCFVLSLSVVFSSCKTTSKQEEDTAFETSIEITTEEEKVTIIASEGNQLKTRFNTPKGYQRTSVEEGSFAQFLRDYPLKEDGSPVLLYNGQKKAGQNAHAAVFQLPIENEDLQQCADSVMRMYAEYYWHGEQYDKIMFHLSDGFELSYMKWREGYRVGFEDDKPYWYKKTEYDSSYETFVKYMRIVFAYAGTASMEALETKGTRVEELKIGDVFIKGGSPGHVVMVVDVCEKETGEKAFLLAQGYMPAQEFHVIKNPAHENDPWYYEGEVTYPFRTAQYTFEEGSLRTLTY